MHNVGMTEQFIGVRAAPDVNNRRRLFAWMRRFGQDMSGQSGDVIYGYDRGNAAHSFNGPVALSPNPGAAVNAPQGEMGIYKTQGEFQDFVSSDPGLDPYYRNLWLRKQNVR